MIKKRLVIPDMIEKRFVELARDLHYTDGQLNVIWNPAIPKDWLVEVYVCDVCGQEIEGYPIVDGRHYHIGCHPFKKELDIIPSALSQEDVNDLLLSDPPCPNEEPREVTAVDYVDTEHPGSGMAYPNAFKSSLMTSYDDGIKEGQRREQAKHEPLLSVFKQAETLCQTFVDKVESGRARSKETYGACKGLLKQIEAVKQEQGV